MSPLGLRGVGREGILIDTRVPGLVEGEDFNVVGGVFLNDAFGFVIGVERVHKDEGNVNVLGFVQELVAIKKQNGFS